MWAEVLAINAAGLQSSIRSAPFRVVPECALTVRGSAPLVIRSLDGNLNVSWAFDLPTHAACQRAGWNIVSPRWFYAVGTRPFATDLLEFTLGPFKDNPDDPASVGGDLQLIGLPLQTKQRIYLSFVTVNCVSGIKTHVFSTLNDIAPPVPAAPIFDGGRIGVDATVQADATALTANWLSFIDAETFVVSYEWAIGSAPFAEDVQSFTMVNRSVAYTAALGSWKVAATGLALVVNSTYYVTVRATDYMGNAATAASDGILVSLLFPLPGDIVLTSIAHEDDPVNEDAEAFYQSDVTSVHIRWFNFSPSALGVWQGGNNTSTNGTSAPIDATANCEWNDIECRKQADASLQPAQSFVDAAGISIADYSVGLSTLAGIEHGRYDVTTLRSVGLVSSYTFAGLNLSAGVYVATVQVTNSLGHTTFATSANVIVDITAPRVISSKPVAIAQALSFGFVRGPVLDVNWSTSFSEPESIITRYSYTVLHVNQKLSATCRVPASLLQAAVWHTTTLTSVQLRLERPGISYRVFVKARNGASLDSEAAQSRTVVWDPTEPTAGKVYHVPQQGDDFQFASNYQTVTNQVSAVWYESNTATGTPTFCQPFELADSLSSASRPSWTIAQGSSYSRSVIWSAQNALFEPRGATLSARSNIAAHTGVGAQIGRRLSFPFPYREEHPSFVNVETQASVSFSLRAASGFNYRTAIFIIYPASSAALSSDTVYALSSEAGVYRDSGMFGLVIDGSDPFTLRLYPSQNFTTAVNNSGADASLFYPINLPFDATQEFHQYELGFTKHASLTVFVDGESMFVSDEALGDLSQFHFSSSALLFRAVPHFATVLNVSDQFFVEEATASMTNLSLTVYPECPVSFFHRLSGIEYYEMAVGSQPFTADLSNNAFTRIATNLVCLRCNPNATCVDLCGPDLCPATALKRQGSLTGVNVTYCMLNGSNPVLDDRAAGSNESIIGCDNSTTGSNATNCTITLRNGTAAPQCFVSVRGCSRSGVCTLASSSEFYIDPTPPVLEIELTSFVDPAGNDITPAPFQSSPSSIYIRWKFIDSESGIERQHWRIDAVNPTAPFRRVVLDWTEISSSAVIASAQGLSLRHRDNVTISVKALSGAAGSAVATTNVLIDLTAPLAGKLFAETNGIMR